MFRVRAAAWRVSCHVAAAAPACLQRRQGLAGREPPCGSGPRAPASFLGPGLSGEETPLYL